MPTFLALKSSIILVSHIPLTSKYSQEDLNVPFCWGKNNLVSCKAGTRFFQWIGRHFILACFQFFKRFHFKLPSLAKGNINFATATKKRGVLTPSQPVLLYPVLPDTFTQMKFGWSGLTVVTYTEAFSVCVVLLVAWRRQPSQVSFTVTARKDTTYATLA